MQAETFPLVSVGLPTFNRSSSLSRAINSVLHQTYPNIELIISDNASTDETQLICEKFTQHDKRVTYIRQKSNLGAANNFLEVLKQSTGEYFMWLGDDDWIDHSYISECLSHLMKYSDYSLVAGKPLFYMKGKLAYEDISINLTQDNRFDRVLSYYKQVGENGVFYGLTRKSQISSIAIPSTIGGDWLMIASLAFLGKIKTIEHVFVHRESNWSDDYHKKLAERLGLSNFQANNPHISIAISASRDIISNLQVYGDLSLIQRIVLSQKVLLMILKEKHVSSYHFSPLIFLRLALPNWAYTYLRKMYRRLQRKTDVSEINND